MTHFTANLRRLPPLRHTGGTAASTGRAPRAARALRLTAAALATFATLTAITGPARAADTSPAQQLQRWSGEAGTPGQAERGRLFFTNPHGGDWACATCHGNPPVAPGKHATTGKRIDPMAPAVNPAVFTDTARVDKWFRRNCKDVVQRECTPAEKADVLAYLISLKP